jgi:hypothetical protein
MKRQRCEVPTWWTEISDEIQSGGGHVHSTLSFDEGRRTLTVTDKVDGGTVLMSIPSRYLITKDRAILLCPWLKSIGPEHSPIIDEEAFKNSAADLWIAMALACESPDNLLYLQSLPEPSSFDALPRRWSDDDLQDLLSGTSLLERAKAAKRDLIADYSLLKTLFEGSAVDVVKGGQDEIATGGGSASFQPFQTFSDMLAAVSSRAFQVGTTDQDVAIVPLLDLCDHARGLDSRKNVSYEIQDDGSMLVRSTGALGPGERLKLTYGALGNTQLLLNYGFCIPHNLEPDGSANDVLEFRIQSSSTSGTEAGASSVIYLRTGPKSYSYGPFTSVVDRIFERQVSDKPLGGVDDESDVGLQKFLDDEGDNDDSSRDFDDIYGGDSDIEESDKCVGKISRGEANADEMDALMRFRHELIRLYEGYPLKGPELKTALSLKPCPRFYSAVLCQSELRTIAFFVRAIDKVQSLLNKGNAPNLEHFSFHPSENDLSLIEEQTTALAKAYMAIRHGE